MKFGAHYRRDDGCERDHDVYEQLVKDIDTIYVHPKYNRYEHSYDIALIKLFKPVVFTKWVAPVMLQYSVTVLPEEHCHAVGWGKTETGEVAKQLEFFDLRIRSHLDCWKLIKTLTDRALLDTTMFCAGEVGSDKPNTCSVSPAFSI